MHLRASNSNRRARWRRRGAAGIAVAVAAVLAVVVPALGGPVGDAAGFEDDDGNLAPEAPINFDWNSFAPTTWTGSAPERTSNKVVNGWAFTGLEDAQATTSDSAFAGGTKQDNDCASVGTGKAPNKDDLKRVYVASNTVDGDVFLELSWARIPQNTTSPSAHIGFEFNQGDTACPPGSDDLVGRTAGDMLIVYDFEGGDTDNPTITLRRWVTSGTCEVGGNSAPPCWGPSTNLTALGFAEARVNTSTVGPVTDQIAPSPPENLGLNEFGEAGINLTDAGVFPENACVAFGKAFAVSRSSGNSATAQMKDLVGPGDVNITNCGNVIIRKVTDPSPDPTDTTFTYSTTGGLDPDTFGLKDGESFDYGNEVFTGSYTVTEDDPSPDFALADIDCSASETSHGSTVNTDVPAGTVSFDLQPLDTIDCTYTNQLQRGALRIVKESTKSGSLVSNPGAVFSYDGASVTDNGAGDEDPTVGVVCVSGLQTGTYTVNETSPPPGYGGATQTDQTATVVVGTNCTDNQPSGANSATFTNAPLADIQVNFRDGGSGETSATSIVCDNTGTTPDTTPASGWDDSVTHEDISIDPSPRTVTCTIEIDP
ncbi:MAG TPA: hypothetical protein VE575_11260 [Acidimicrobiales bacterium]|nr:hypothetical protein [Acidimicrobiales bacterium]